MRNGNFLGAMIAALAASVGLAGRDHYAPARQHVPPFGRRKVFFSGISRGVALGKYGTKAVSVAASKRAARKRRNIRARSAK